MQRFFIVSLFLIFSCQSAEKTKRPNCGEQGSIAVLKQQREERRSAAAAAEQEKAAQEKAQKKSLRSPSYYPGSSGSAFKPCKPSNTPNSHGKPD
jgi:hypothetical protein